MFVCLFVFFFSLFSLLFFRFSFLFGFLTFCFSRFSGRDPSTQIPLNDQSVSRRHARINKEGDLFRLTDLGSANVRTLKKDAQNKISIGNDFVFLGNSRE